MVSTNTPGSRILHYAPSFLPITCNWIYPQVAKLRENEAWVVAHARENPEAFPFDRLILSPTEPVTRWRDLDLARRLRFTRDLGRSIEQVSPDVIHAHFGNGGACIARVARKLGIPLITSFYGSDLSVMQYRWWRIRYRYLFRHGARFLCEGPHAAQQLAAMGCPADKCRVLRLGVDLAGVPFERREPNPDGHVRILIASSLRLRTEY